MEGDQKQLAGRSCTDLAMISWPSQGQLQPSKALEARGTGSYVYCMFVVGFGVRGKVRTVFRPALSEFIEVSLSPGPLRGKMCFS